MISYLRRLVKGNDKDNPFDTIDKVRVINDTKGFEENNVRVSHAKIVMLKLLYLIIKGVEFTQEQLTPLFFRITKLFQCPDLELRKLTYQLIKQVNIQSSIYIVTNCIVKDIAQNPLYRAQALRTVHLIIDPYDINQLQRNVKPHILDKNNDVSNSALFAAIHLVKKNQEVIKNWASSIQKKVETDKKISHQSLILLHLIRSNDKNAVSKLLYDFTNCQTTPLATIQLLRYIGNLIKTMQINQGLANAFAKFTIKMLNSNIAMIELQAAKLACSIPYFDNKDLIKVINSMQKFLLSKQTVKKYAALGIYNIFLKNPSRRMLISTKHIESLLYKDRNRTISSMAASILLKVCKQQHLQQSLKRIFQNTNQITMDFKIDVLQSIKLLLEIHPHKFQIIFKRILTLVQHDMEIQLKKQIIEVFHHALKKIPEAREEAFKNLAQITQDCNSDQLHFHVLGIISREYKKTDSISFLKYLLGRIQLQKSSIRACTISTLQKIAMQAPKCQKVQIEQFIKIAQNDNDQQVLHRLINPCPAFPPLDIQELMSIQKYIHNKVFSQQNLNNANILSLKEMQKWKQTFVESIEEEEKQGVVNKPTEEYIESLKTHQVFSKYGQIYHSCPGQQISDKGGQLQVILLKYICSQHIILEFKVTNKYQLSILQNVQVNIKIQSQDFQMAHIVPVLTIKPKQTSNVYVGLARNPQQIIPIGRFKTTLQFYVNQMNNKGQLQSKYEEEYYLQEFAITKKDYMQPKLLKLADFQKLWQKLPYQKSSSYQMNFKNTQSAVESLYKHFGLSKIEHEQKHNSKYYQMKLCGTHMNNDLLLLTIRIGFDSKLGCIINLSIKSKQQPLIDNLLNSLDE